jgi:hypothetical protein
VNLVNDVATAEISRAMRGAGVRAIVLKGPATRHWLYEPMAPRLSLDVDLLLSWGQLEQAERALDLIGYRFLGIDAVGPDRPHCRIWEHPSGMMLELHRRIAGIGLDCEAAWERLSRETETLEVAGTPVEVLSAPARALHLALHAAQHGEAFDKTLLDLKTALERLPDNTWMSAARLAEELDAEAAFVAGLRLDPAGETLVERMELKPRPTMPTEVILRARSAPVMSEGIEWMSRLTPWKKALFALRHVVPPAGYMRVWSPRARRSRFGLALAYLWRPVWLATHLAPALRTWRRARRSGA